MRRRRRLRVVDRVRVGLDRSAARSVDERDKSGEAAVYDLAGEGRERRGRYYVLDNLRDLAQIRRVIGHGDYVRERHCAGDIRESDDDVWLRLLQHRQGNLAPAVQESEGRDGIAADHRAAQLLRDGAGDLRLGPSVQRTGDSRSDQENPLKLGRRAAISFELRTHYRGVWLQLSERKALLEPLVANRVEPKLVAEISYLTWTGNNLLRHTANVGLRKTSRPTQVAGRRASLAGRNSVFYFTTLEQPATGRSRRLADIADSGLGRLNWADSVPTAAEGRPESAQSRQSISSANSSSSGLSVVRARKTEV
jgi:hypothetical protein